MSILVINGAPRKAGYTRELTELFCAGARAAGDEPEVVDLTKQDIRPCIGCYGCWKPSSPGRCVQHDDMTELLERVLDSTYLMLATPLYFFSFSAIMKAFLERLFPLVKPDLEISPEMGLLRNVRRFPDRGPQGLGLIACGGYRSPQNMDGLVETFDLICDGFDTECVGKLLRTEAFFLDFSDSKPITHRKIRAAFENAGRELIANGRISPQTEADAAAPLTASDDVYLERTGVYWAIADDLGTHYADREQLRELAAVDLRILVPELASCLDPNVAGDLAAVIQLDLAGDAEHSWHLQIEGGRCRALRGVHPQPELTLTLDEPTLVDMIFCRLDVRSAVADGTIGITGSKGLLGRMARLFPPPNR